MASNKTVAAAFAAGAISAGGGVDQLSQQEIDAANGRADAAQAVVEQVDVNNPTIKSYLRFAAEKGVTDILEKRLIPDRADQMRLLAEDIKADITTGETAPLNQLGQALAEKTSETWLTWYSQNFWVHLQAQIQIGLAVGNLKPDQLVRLADVIEVMESMAGLYITPHNPGAEAQWQETLKTLEEVSDEESAAMEKGLAR